MKTCTTCLNKKTLENTEEAITIGQSRETGNIGCTRRRLTKQKIQHNVIPETHRAHYILYLRCYLFSISILNPTHSIAIFYLNESSFFTFVIVMNTSKIMLR